MILNTRLESWTARVTLACAFPFVFIGKRVDANLRSFRSNPYAWIDKQLMRLGKAFLVILVVSALLLAVEGYGREVLEVIGGGALVVSLLWVCHIIFLRYDEKPTPSEIAEVQALLKRMARENSHIKYVNFFEPRPDLPRRPLTIIHSKKPHPQDPQVV